MVVTIWRVGAEPILLVSVWPPLTFFRECSFGGHKTCGGRAACEACRRAANHLRKLFVTGFVGVEPVMFKSFGPLAFTSRLWFGVVERLHYLFLLPNHGLPA